MDSIAFPILLMLLLSLLTATLGYLASKKSHPLGLSLIGLSLLALLLHATVYGNTLYMAQLLPTSNAIVYGNLQPPAAALLAGAACALLHTPVWQRTLLTLTLATIAIYQAWWPLFGSPPPLQPDRWTNGVCRQSTKATCSAAAAATALHAVGIQTTESEMGSLCLTRPWGTTTLGIYRGLKLKTTNTPYDAQPFTGTLDRLLALPPAPTVLSIGSLARNPDGTTTLLPGGAHSIVLLSSLPDGQLHIADPFTGPQTMPRSTLQSLYLGDAIRVTPRPSP